MATNFIRSNAISSFRREPAVSEGTSSISASVRKRCHTQNTGFLAGAIRIKRLLRDRAGRRGRGSGLRLALEQDIDGSSGGHFDVATPLQKQEGRSSRQTEIARGIFGHRRGSH